MTSALLQQIVRGLDGVTGGKWCQFHPHYCEEAIGTSCADWDTSHDLSAVKDGTRRRIASFKHADDAAHVDRCSPDAIREIAAYVRDLEERLAKAAEALEPFAKEADIYDPPNGDDAHPAWSNDFPIGTLRRARTALTTIQGNNP